MYQLFPPTGFCSERLGFGALVERSVCAGRGKWRVACLRLDDFRCVGNTTQLGIEKFFPLAVFYTRGQLILRSWFPISEEFNFEFDSPFRLGPRLSLRPEAHVSTVAACVPPLSCVKHIYISFTSHVVGIWSDWRGSIGGKTLGGTLGFRISTCTIGCYPYGDSSAVFHLHAFLKALTTNSPEVGMWQSELSKPHEEGM